MEQPRAEIGVFGGSGFYSLLEDATEHKMTTPYGPPSSPGATKMSPGDFASVSR